MGGSFEEDWNRVASSIRSSKTELWYAWAEIAIKDEREAWQGRRAAKAALNHGQTPVPGIERETKGAMSAVVAAAACVEALANELQQFVPKVTGPAPRRVVDVMRSVFGEVIDQPVVDEIQWLFDFRNTTIHYRAEWAELQAHPAFGMLTTRVASTYTKEAATRGVDVVESVLKSVVKPGRSEIREAGWWASRWRSLPDDLHAERPKR